MLLILLLARFGPPNAAHHCFDLIHRAQGGWRATYPTVHDAVALRGELDSILKILYHKDLRDGRTPTHPSTGNITSAF